jgi:hypothetical protein
MLVVDFSGTHPFTAKPQMRFQHGQRSGTQVNAAVFAGLCAIAVDPSIPATQALLILITPRAKSMSDRTSAIASDGLRPVKNLNSS